METEATDPERRQLNQNGGRRNKLRDGVIGGSKYESNVGVDVTAIR